MTGRLYRPETPREQKMQSELDKLFYEAIPPGGCYIPLMLRDRQPTRWERMVAALKRLVGY